MQAALLLAGRGHKVILSERAPAIGGLFPLLDNQFPTQSCGVCFMACDTPTYCPFVQCDLHENVTVAPSSTVTSVEKDEGSYKVTLTTTPTCVSAEKCTDCGACEAVCPVEVKREFGDGLEMRKAIYRYYPKAVGKGYVVDRESCTNCGKCVEVCASEAIDLDAEGGETEVKAGAVILASGAEIIPASIKGEFGFGRYDNVLSAVKFERMLAAGSPSSGMPVRPSDQKAPESLAFVQCVGSRDPANGRSHCSSVCCMFTLKQALFAKERMPELDVTIYYMDMRAFGKDYERYIRMAEEAGINFVRAMPSVMRQTPESLDIEVTVSKGGELVKRSHSMVILAAGFEQSPEASALGLSFGVEMTPNGAVTDEFSPCAGSAEGVFLCGNVTGAKDIPESTQEGAAAAALAAKVLDLGALEEFAPGPTPVDWREEEPRVGVVLCECDGYNTSRVDFDELEERVKAKKDVDFVSRVAHGCTKAGMSEVRNLFGMKEPNRLLFAACTDRIVEKLYRHMFKEMGVHEGVLELTNLREACQTSSDAAFGQISGAVKSSMVAGFSPRSSSALDKTVLVIGGGVAGMSASLALAGMGHPVHLVEREQELGGLALTGAFTVKGGVPRELAAELRAKVEAEALVTVYTSAAVHNAGGRLGAFNTTLMTQGGPVEVLHGAALLATGANPADTSSYGYGQVEGVVTQKELEGLLDSGEFKGGKVVMIQCVDSREEAEGCRPYCSRVCCTHAIKNARRILKDSPESSVNILYRDLRAYGDFEKYYQAAREEGVIFTAFDLEKRPKVEGKRVSWIDNSFGGEVTAAADYVVLSVGMVPQVEENLRLASLYGLDLDDSGFFVEKSSKAATTDFVRPGLYLAGTAHAPKHFEETIVQALAAAGRAGALLSARELTAPANVSYVDERLCSRCGLCVETCPYGARELDNEINLAVVDPLICKACGNCVAICPNKAAQQYGASPEQVLAKLDELI